MTKALPLMVQGTASNAGKSILATGLCRVFKQDGFSVAPFKSQNMALNSFITQEGLEMGRAQVTQAEAAGVEPSVLMNPILLKPTGDAKSQIIVEGEVWNNLTATEYYDCKAQLRPRVQQAYDRLAAQHDIIVIEGAGSPAEINLQKDDFVNMGMAALVDAPVVLVGDIDRGGVFASLYGTIKLLDEADQRRIKGIIINKFRGDVTLLRPGLKQLEELCNVPVIGVVPWVNLDIDDEDSVSSRLAVQVSNKPVDIAVIHLPHISNFTDFTALEQHPALGVRYVKQARQLGKPDLIILPGTKNTLDDLLWLRQEGLESAIKKLCSANTPLIGICGGYQMLGTRVNDPHGVERGGEVEGMGLLSTTTIFDTQKTRTRVQGRVKTLEGFYAPLSGAHFEGYEIHMGSTCLGNEAAPFSSVQQTSSELLSASKEIESTEGEHGDRGSVSARMDDGAVQDRILGSYIHGLFDSGDIAERLAAMLLERKGLSLQDVDAFDYEAHKQQQYDLLATTLRNSVDIQALYSMMHATAR